MFKTTDTFTRRTGFTIVELLVVVAIVGMLAAIAIPQYSKYRRRALNSAAVNACHNVAVAQEAYFILAANYTSNYSALVEDSGLGIDENVLYGPITLILTTDPPSYSFSTNHKSDGTTTFTYDSAGAPTTLVEGGPRVTANDPSVPAL
ncbi:MAG: prepilin-type N-terminal cleavage/methylation domain-containing protein [Deltaproteobacteria bacterium]|jgi:prepilin-type N-terminal cleavage/methylation domain-containing protein|nr:prepilin-type N-terminal cleavage/methylation domain-containing protein [Deltaproteobacteria bacterium]